MAKARKRTLLAVVYELQLLVEELVEAEEFGEEQKRIRRARRRQALLIAERTKKQDPE